MAKFHLRDLERTRGSRGRHLKSPKFENIFVAVITFFSFCANNYYTSLLLIVCALRWYIKSLYRHLFLVDISKNARVTHFLICGKDNSKAPWATRPQIGMSVAKARSCDTHESKKNFRWTPPQLVVRRGEITEMCRTPTQFCDPASITHGGSPGAHLTWTSWEWKYCERQFVVGIWNILGFIYILIQLDLSRGQIPNITTLANIHYY